MYQEISKRENLSLFRLFFIICIITSILIVFNIVFSFIDINSSLNDIFNLLLGTLFTFYIIKKYIISFKYTIISNEFIIQEKIGTKETTLINIDINQISSIQKNKEKNRYFSKNKMYNCIGKEDIYYITYEEENKLKLIIIQPSNKLVKLLKDKLNVYKNI